MTKFIEPKRPVKVKWEISDQTRAIVEYYARCVGYSEEEVADRFLKNLLGDPRFAKFLRGQRRNKRMISRMFYGDESMSAINEYIGGTGMQRDVFGEFGEEITEDEVRAANDK